MATGNKVVEEAPIEKIYWTIGEVAESLKISKSCIRFWEKEFNLNLHRNKKGNRFFTLKDLKLFKVIHELIITEGYTLKGAKRQLEINPGLKPNKLAVIT